MDKFENFIFITACTKFSQFSLTSGLNNLSFIGFDSEYDTLCGITKEEAIRYFKPEINKLAACKGWTFDEAAMQLSSYYGGYHFSSRNKVDVFNPFCLINALADSDLKNYWFSSGTSPLLSKFEDDIKKRLKDFEYCPIISNTLETSDVTGGGAELVLYQTGYLTIKDYMTGIYLLGFPNSEVKNHFMRRYCQHLLQKLSNNGGVDAAEEQVKAKQYAEPFKADKRKVIALAIELDDMGKGLVDWKEV